MNPDETRTRLIDSCRPFVIKPYHGREFQVPNRELTLVTHRSVVVADKGGFVDILDPLHIASIRDGCDFPAC
jgi:hypothetical protein